MTARILFNKDLTELFDKGAAVLFEELGRINANYINVAVPGGRSIVGLLKAMFAKREMLSKELWSRLQFFMVDERLVSIDDKESNFKLVNELCLVGLINSGLVTEEQLHPFIYNANVNDFGVKGYEHELNSLGGRFDVVLLGVGEDGHAAALYPHHPVIADKKMGFCALLDSPKPPAQRMTASAALIREAKIGMALFIGEGKRQAYINYLNKGLEFEDCPAKIVDQTACPYILTDIELS